jgi:ABC-type nitrate/sulfonate/bicarbonate transport system substrate-binding protein
VKRSDFVAATAGAGAVMLTRAPARAATEIVFGSLSPSTSEWMLYVAEQRGFFTEQGLHITTISVGNVQNSINSVATKAADFVSIGSDSVMAAQAHDLPVKLVIPGYNTMPYGLVVGPNIKTWADLRGKTVAVGAKTDVTGILLRIMAKANNLDPDRDLTTIVSGSTSARFIALQSGNVDAVFLNPPFDFYAESKGMRILARASDYAKPWQFSGYVMNTDWLLTHRKEAVALARAFRKAVDFSYKNPAGAIDVLATASQNDQASCKKAYDLAFVKTKAFDRNLKFDETGIRAVAQAMLGVGTITTIPKVSDVIDASIGQEATR